MIDTPEGFELDTSGQPLTVKCIMCGWYSEGNRSDSSRFLHSLKVHAWNFCPPRLAEAEPPAEYSSPNYRPEDWPPHN